MKDIDRRIKESCQDILDEVALDILKERYVATNAILTRSHLQPNELNVRLFANDREIEIKIIE